MSVSWDFYSGRRGVTVKSVLEANSIKSYKDLVNHLRAVGVKAPSREVCSHLFDVAAEKMILPTLEELPFLNYLLFLKLNFTIILRSGFKCNTDIKKRKKPWEVNILEV